MKLWANGKLSHWPDYQNLPEDFQIEGGVEIPGNPQAFSLEGGSRAERRLRMIRMSLGGFQDAFVVGPENPDEPWRYVFKDMLAGRRRQQICSIALEGAAKILRGQSTLLVGGVQRDSLDPVKIRAVGPFPNRGNLPLV